ncbi:MAG TPA: glycosyltransferase family 2 protein [Burkholderiales bacterium]|nr:glycosyltransferase family 2 protein [Burkholderiales bacterium]
MMGAEAGEPRYAVVIPAYNEAATIADVAARALAQVERVIVVDDGSTDGTAAALANVPVTVLRNDRNLGKGGSLWRGMRHALGLGAAGVVTLDGDGQHAPEEIGRLLAAARAHPGEIIIGARWFGREAAPRARYVANRIADFFIGWAAGQALDDSQSGFRVYPATVLQRVEVHHGPARGFVFESEVLITAARLGIPSRAVPIAALYPHGARQSHFCPVLDIARISRMILWKLVSRGLNPAGLYRVLAGRQAERASAIDETA